MARGLAYSIIVLALMNTSLAFASDVCGNEYWGRCDLGVAVTDYLDVKAQTEFRYRESLDDNYHSYLDLGCNWTLCEWCVVGANLRTIRQASSTGWETEYRPHLNCVFKVSAVRLSLSDRSRLEYRILEEREFFRYRNKFAIKSPKMTSLEIRPEVAVEPFYDFDAGEINKNRVYLGFGLRIVGELKAKLDYILEFRKKRGDWTDVDVFEFTLSYSL